jgi:hypothetical protein
MKRLLFAASILILLAVPAQAALPLALIAKQIIKQVVKDFIESELTALVRQSLGPCKSMLADMGVGAAGTIQGVVSGARGMAGGSIPGVAGLPGAVGAVPGGMDAVSMASPEARRAMEGMLGAQGIDPATHAQIMQHIQGGIPGMESATPLSTEEVDELVTRLVALSKAMPDQALPCPPEELKLVFNMTASMPMVSGPFRMMLEQFRAMDQRFAEVQETFAKMSDAERAEAVDLMVADVPSMSAEERKQFAGFFQSDLLGLPASVREQLLARLASMR